MVLLVLLGGRGGSYEWSWGGGGGLISGPKGEEEVLRVVLGGGGGLMSGTENKQSHWAPSSNNSRPFSRRTPAC